MKNLIFASLLLFSFFSSAQSIEIEREIPILIRQGVPIVKVQVNGKTRAMLLDTGASSSVLAMEYKKSINFKSYASNRSEFSGLGGKSTTQIITNTNILDMNNNPMHVIKRGIKLKGVISHINIVGILGSDFLSNGWLIDYKNNRLIKVQ